MDNSQGNNGDYRRRGEIKPMKQGKEIEGKEARDGESRQRKGKGIEENGKGIVGKGRRRRGE
jgi:hypothetical protein